MPSRISFLHSTPDLWALRPLAVACALILSASPLGAQDATASVRDTAIVLPAVRIDTLLDLETVIRRALAVSPAAAQAEALLRTTRSEVRVARGEFMPSVTAATSALQSNILSNAPPGTSTATAYSAGVSSSVEVFTGGRRGADRARANADVSAAEALDVTQRYSVILAARRAFYESLRGRELLTVASARVARAERGLKYAQDRVRAGTATRSDELRARLELSAGRQQQLAATDTLQTSAWQLGRLVGSEGPVGAQPPASLDPVPLALADSEIVRLAVDAAPAVRAAEAQARATDAATRVARSLYFPDVRLTGGYNWAAQAPVVVGAARPGWQLALGTSFPIFNGFLREDAVTRAEAAADVARVTSLDARRLVRADAARLLSALRLSAQSVALAADAVTAAQEDLRVQTQRYRAGISTSLDQLSSELALTQAELALVAARFNYQNTRASLEALVGRPL